MIYHKSYYDKIKIMQQYINKAIEESKKSMARDHRHGAVCVIGGKIVSCGHNYVDDPHQIKGSKESD